MAKFTNRHYEEIAEFTAREIFSLVQDKETQDAIIRRFCYFFKGDNEAFKNEVFISRVIDTAIDHTYRTDQKVAMPYGTVEVEA
jgi:hypothetical protein